MVVAGDEGEEGEEEEGTRTRKKLRRPPACRPGNSRPDSTGSTAGPRSAAAAAPAPAPAPAAASAMACPAGDAVVSGAGVDCGWGRPPQGHHLLHCACGKGRRLVAGLGRMQGIYKCTGWQRGTCHNWMYRFVVRSQRVACRHGGVQHRFVAVMVKQPSQALQVPRASGTKCPRHPTRGRWRRFACESIQCVRPFRPVATRGLRFSCPVAAYRLPVNPATCCSPAPCRNLTPARGHRLLLLLLPFRLHQAVRIRQAELHPHIGVLFAQLELQGAHWSGKQQVNRGDSQHGAHVSPPRAHRRTGTGTKSEVPGFQKRLDNVACSFTRKTPHLVKVLVLRPQQHVRAEVGAGERADGSLGQVVVLRGRTGKAVTGGWRLESGAARCVSVG